MSVHNTLDASSAPIDLNDISPIQVFIRIKLDNSNEPYGIIPIKYSRNNTVLNLLDSQSFLCDRVFPPQSTQSDIFQSIVPLLQLPLCGYNSTIFAYGQTNSGKTYTMLGPNGKLSLVTDLMGLIPRTSRYLFAAIDKITSFSSTIQYQVRTSYLEIYNGRVYDLLRNNQNQNQNNSRVHSLNVRGDNQGNVNVIDAVEIPVNNSIELEKILIQGNETRATASTCMNSSSSRSHALLIIWIERRERSISSSSREYVSYLGRLNLIDLAGSEDISRSKAEGDRFREAVNINTELLQLRRVLDALSTYSSHIPYRDSTLTRLLQSSLSTTQSITILISHISPLAIDLSETLSTLKYSQIAKCVKRTSIPTQHLCKNIDTSDVMFGDFDDPVQYFYRRTVYIHTPTYGKIFARLAGHISCNEQNKCILLVHGSGPTNSSIYWNDFVRRLLVATSSSSSPSSYYFVAIDCPGYGRSEGSKQTVRSYPGAFIQEIINCISPKTHQVYCLVGSSQGAAAVFNALVEKSGISSFVAVQDPVSHDPQRFVCIKQPALLIYDVDDDGHPVSVGRIVKKCIPNNHYYEFASSKQPNWLEENEHLKLLELFDDYDTNNRRANASSLQSMTSSEISLPGCFSVAGGIVSYLSSYDREPLYENSKKELESILSEHESRCVQNNDLFVEKVEPKIIEDDESKAQRLAAESAQTQCDLCNQHISNNLTSKSLRLADCRHFLCYSCCCETIKINSYECPIVGCEMKLNISSSQLSSYELPFSSNNEKQIIIQFGNSCKTVSSSSQRYEYKAFVKCKTQNLIDCVLFDINPDYPKSAIRVSVAPYELVRIMGIEFTCDFIIQWNKSLNWPKLRITYHVQNKQDTFTRNLLVRVSNQDNTRIKSKKQQAEVVYNWTDRDRTKPNINNVTLCFD